ncbi:6-phosphogluconolactonase [Phyllobacterium salinisoli]|uniref:6-phosphogluconolactonase n=1 Tax=Phyllobacterium salinisoli TaxID=1899321 RepID=A0A368K746_9HYPH|nr:6-phosphogluconolactonase [Phyllobacterium salinisoli]RCS25169.1 6-phosphogluconolactonase [Phyllobacterium salinisoli]
MAVEWHDFASSRDLAEALSAQIAACLTDGIKANGQAVLAVSGGTTPIALFEALSQQDIDWSGVTVTLVDERFVSPESERSNERLVHTHLLKDNAAQAKFVGLYNPALVAETAAIAAANRIDALSRPFDVVVLGMGTDGHTASFFPGGDRLDQAIDPESKALVLPMLAEGAGEPRLTLTLPVIAEARFIVLHIEGAAKREVLARAMQEGEETEMPIRAVLNHAQTPVHVFWAN